MLHPIQSVAFDDMVVVAVAVIVVVAVAVVVDVGLPPFLDTH